MRAILYLHGVGQEFRAEGWFDTLNTGPGAHGIDPISRDSRRLIAPDYIELLKSPIASAGKVDEPKITRPKVDRRRQQQLMWEYARAQEQALHGLTNTVDGEGLSRGAGILKKLDVNKLPAVSQDLKDAQRYLSNPDLRHVIMHRVLGELNGRRDLLVIGHSLGAVIALDLLNYLPDQVSVSRLITLGSPLGQMLIHRSDPRRLREKDFPYGQIKSWVNVISPWDIVTNGLGTSPLFPQAVDVRITLPVGRHSAVSYLGHPTVGQLVARSLEPPASEVSSVGAVDLRVTNEEEIVLNGLAYAGVVQDRLKGDRNLRYAEARQSVQISVVDALIRARTADGRPVPSRLLDAADGVHVPTMVSSQDLEQDLAFAIVSATGNPIAPYDIEVSAKGHPDLLETWRRLGYLPSHGKEIATALADAEIAFRSVPRRRYARGAVGLALVAAVPTGQAVPAGLASAAALTSSLATFGPGGMLGGMMLAGGLIGTGSATAAFDSMSLLSEDMLETEVVRRMAASLSRRSLGLPDDGTSWRLFTYWHSELAAEQERQRSVSDIDSRTMTVLRRKLRITQRAIRWMAANELAPSLDA